MHATLLCRPKSMAIIVSLITSLQVKRASTLTVTLTACMDSFGISRSLVSSVFLVWVYHASAYHSFGLSGYSSFASGRAGIETGEET